MRFLIVCMQFPVADGESYMTTELADALVLAGHDVEVLLLDWRAEAGSGSDSLTSPTGVRVVRCAPRGIGPQGSLVANATKFIFSGRHLARTARDELELERFDAAIAWMPAIAIAPLLPLLKEAGIEHRLLFIWDFFPDHHHQIGRIPGGPAYNAAKFWERRLIRYFTAIICTLPGNAEYLRRHYPLAPDQQVLVSPIWYAPSQRRPVDAAQMRAIHHLPAEPPIAVFGGQLVQGRGFEQMLGAADAALAAGSPLLFLFVGDGPLAAMIAEKAARQPNTLYRPAMKREAYLDLLGACDVGMVATVPGVTSFSVPTKTIDYLRSGLPVVAAVERGSDFVEILERYGVGSAVPFNQPTRFQQEAERLATDPAARSSVRLAAPRCLDEVFDVRHAVATIMQAVGAEGAQLPQSAAAGSKW